MRDKSHYNFLIALSRQLAEALEDDGDDDVAVALASLAVSLEVLLVDNGGAAVEDSPRLPQSEYSDPGCGDGAELAALRAELAALRGGRGGAPATLDVTRRVTGGIGTTDAGRELMAGEQPRPALLKQLQRGRARTRVKRRAVRRGKK